MIWRNYNYEYHEILGRWDQICTKRLDCFVLFRLNNNKLRLKVLHMIAEHNHESIQIKGRGVLNSNM